MRSRLILTTAICLLASAAFGQINSSTYRYVAINFPGASSTTARGINNLGEIVGFFTVGQTDCTPPIPAGCQVHGFKLVNKVFTKIDIPGATQTFAFGVNDHGDIAGTYFTSDGHDHGFLLHHTGFLQTINQPGASFTSVTGVNNSLTVCGFSDVSGFIWKNGAFTKVDFTVPGQGQNEEINGISNLGVLAGSIFRLDFFFGFQKTGTDLDIFQRLGSFDTHLNGVNSRDDLVGTNSGVDFGGFVVFHNEASDTGEGQTTETLKHPVFLHFPGAQGTVPWSINYNQSIVGSYIDSNSVHHGFLAVH